MNGDHGGFEPRDDDLGEPITELELIRELPGDGFVGRVENGVERRRLGASLLGLGVTGVGNLLREWLSVVASLFDNRK